MVTITHNPGERNPGTIETGEASFFVHLATSIAEEAEERQAKGYAKMSLIWPEDREDTGRETRPYTRQPLSRAVGQGH